MTATAKINVDTLGLWSLILLGSELERVDSFKYLMQAYNQKRSYQDRASTSNIARGLIWTSFLPSHPSSKLYLDET